MCGWGGVPPARAVRTAALIGDSHAAHWRPALEVVAKRKGWRVVSMSRAGCPLISATVVLPTRARVRGCARWNRAVQRWLARHREVSVVFVAQHRVQVAVAKGRSRVRAARAGYARAWRRVLTERRHVIVLRDTPRDTPKTHACVNGAIAAGVPAGPACAVPRSYALRPDPATLAARAVRSPRVQVADLSRVFCSARLCLPVIGGALVHRDTQHMTPQFVRSLTPILLTTVDRLARSWRDPVTRTRDVKPTGASPAVDPRRAPLSPLEGPISAEELALGHVAYPPRRDAHDDRPWRHVVGDDGAGGDERLGADLDAGHEHRAAADAAAAAQDRAA